MALFVGHLVERIKDSALKELFEVYGTVTGIDRKGTYAFVDFNDKLEAKQAAKALNRTEFMGTTLRVELSNRERGKPGPPPGDQVETCYNCQQIGHIAKHCSIPPQPAQLAHLQKTQPNKKSNNRNKKRRSLSGHSWGSVPRSTIDATQEGDSSSDNGSSSPDKMNKRRRTTMQGKQPHHSSFNDDIPAYGLGMPLPASPVYYNISNTTVRHSQLSSHHGMHKRGKIQLPYAVNNQAFLPPGMFVYMPFVHPVLQPTMIRPPRPLPPQVFNRKNI